MSDDKTPQWDEFDWDDGTPWGQGTDEGAETK